MLHAIDYYSHVIMESAAIQATDDISIVIRCIDSPKSTIEWIQSPNICRHWCLCSTTPLSNTILSSFVCSLWK